MKIIQIFDSLWFSMKCSRVTERIRKGGMSNEKKKEKKKKKRGRKSKFVTSPDQVAQKHLIQQQRALDLKREKQHGLFHNQFAPQTQRCKKVIAKSGSCHPTSPPLKEKKKEKKKKKKKKKKERKKEKKRKESTKKKKKKKTYNFSSFLPLTPSLPVCSSFFSKGRTGVVSPFALKNILILFTSFFHSSTLPHRGELRPGGGPMSCVCVCVYVLCVYVGVCVEWCRCRFVQGGGCDPQSGKKVE